MAGFLVGIGKAGEVAERSPAVISANLKEDMLLQKKRLVLERSERNLVHQIKVDQKVVYKNFQSKLVRSKLAFARLMGQKDIEKDLRAKNLGGLNTDIVGSTDEEYAFLEKLEKRPCTATCISPRIEIPKNRKSILSNFNNKVISKTSARNKVTGDHQIGKNENLPSATETNIRNSKPETEFRGLEIRPATTAGVRVDKDFICHQKQMKENSIKALTENTLEKSDTKLITESEHVVNGEKTMLKIALENDRQESEKEEIKDTNLTLESSDSGTIGDKDVTNDSKPTVAFLDELELNLDKLQRPRTVALAGLSDMSNSPPISPKHISRRASRATDFFQEERKIDLVQLRLQAARTVDFTDKVNQFCESLEKTQKSRIKPTSDYYTIRLETSTKERLGSEIVTVPGTPDDENKRAMGNIFIRSLTVPKINWNFVGP